MSLTGLCLLLLLSCAAASLASANGIISSVGAGGWRQSWLLSPAPPTRVHDAPGLVKPVAIESLARADVILPASIDGIPSAATTAMMGPGAPMVAASPSPPAPRPLSSRGLAGVVASELERIARLRAHRAVQRALQLEQVLTEREIARLRRRAAALGVMLPPVPLSSPLRLGASPPPAALVEGPTSSLRSQYTPGANRMRWGQIVSTRQTVVQAEQLRARARELAQRQRQSQSPLLGAMPPHHRPCVPSAWGGCHAPEDLAAPDETINLPRVDIRSTETVLPLAGDGLAGAAGGSTAFAPAVQLVAGSTLGSNAASLPLLLALSALVAQEARETGVARSPLTGQSLALNSLTPASRTQLTTVPTPATAANPSFVSPAALSSMLRGELGQDPRSFAAPAPSSASLARIALSARGGGFGRGGRGGRG